jgi:hypothetical protein
MAVDATAEITVDRPRDDVAAFLWDPANDREWIGGLRSARLVTPAPAATRPRWRCGSRATPAALLRPGRPFLAGRSTARSAGTSAPSSGCWRPGPGDLVGGDGHAEAGAADQQGRSCSAPGDSLSGLGGDVEVAPLP